MPSDHDEFDVIVVAVRSYGLDVTLPDGTPAVVDIAKDPEWPAAGLQTTAGTALHAVVLDDERVPMRMSALADDLEIARRLRDQPGGHDSVSDVLSRWSDRLRAGHDASLG